MQKKSSVMIKHVNECFKSVCVCVSWSGCACVFVLAALYVLGYFVLRYSLGVKQDRLT